MKATSLHVVWSLALLVFNSDLLPGAPLPTGMAAPQQFQDQPPAGGEMSQEEFNKAFSQALQMLAANGDQEAFDTIKKAKENGGKVEISREEAQKFIDRAQKMANGGGAEPDKPAEPAPEEKKEPEKPDPEKVKEAVKELAKKGDKEALAVIEHARKNRGELKVTDEEGRKFIARAAGEEEPKEAKPAGADKDAAEKPNQATAREAVRLLAKNGDKEAKAVIEKARRNREEITLTDADAKMFIDRALEKKLLKEGEEAEERVPPETMKQLIKELEKRGDRDAKSIMRKAKKNDGEITYTEEEEKEIIKNAKKQGLIE
jgi:hypothetical protein